jgi:2-dehydropantoate 2-reductase
MDVLIVGAGVIGSVYGAHLAAAGLSVSILARGGRAESIARDGLVIKNVITGKSLQRRITMVGGDITACSPSLVLIAVRGDQLASACSTVAAVRGCPLLLFFGNNPGGRKALPQDLPGMVRLGFPGLGGQLKGSTVEYAAIRPQPTALDAARDSALDELAAALRGQGLGVSRVEDMDGRLLFHATFIAAVTAALYRCGIDPVRLGADRAVLSLMCHAVSEGFAALRRLGIGGCPGNLALLHRPMLLPVARCYWARRMRSPIGELCFAAHARHARREMLSLADATIARLGGQPHTASLRQLLEGSG